MTEPAKPPAWNFPPTQLSADSRRQLASPFTDVCLLHVPAAQVCNSVVNRVTGYVPLPF